MCHVSPACRGIRESGSASASVRSIIKLMAIDELDWTISKYLFYAVNWNSEVWPLTQVELKPPCSRDSDSWHVFVSQETSMIAGLQLLADEDEVKRVRGDCACRWKNAQTQRRTLTTFPCH